ncbi:hypothetical protein Glove_494g23 [Diversispora epigaea]|uniref:CBM20 domain-containing protein n=1 Tax=Diversispora epigaea TaxID=1348612 RepID=A0A397GLM4_9GLOM|nr:hypothetical protein Glove_494g23 [Diversispora epigaea]
MNVKGSGEIFTVTFHVHLPNFDQTGEPVVLGSCDELGNWNKTNKLEQPDPNEHPTYWRSKPIRFENMSEIKYKYAILFGGLSSHLNYEREGSEQDRTLDTTISDQYDIWLSNKKYFNIGDFAFVDVIYQSIDAKNYKVKIMEYESLLKNHGHHARNVANIEFIVNNLYASQTREKRLFLCVLLGYYIQQNYIIQLPQHFQSKDLLEALENISEETLPSNTLELMPAVLQSLVRHNAIYNSFTWIRIFKSARILDPQFSFVDSFLGIGYNNNNDLNNFFEVWNKSAKPYMKFIGEETYTRIARHLINISRTMSLLIATWKDITDRSINVSNKVRQFFIERIIINSDHFDASASTLIDDYNKIPPDFRNDVIGIFCYKVIYLLKYPRYEWNKNNNLESIEKLLLNESMYWSSDNHLNALEAISQSKEIKILNIFLKLLKHWFTNNNSLEDSKNPKVLSICKDWFNGILTRLNESQNSPSADEETFVFTIFNYLSMAYKVVKDRRIIYDELSEIATTRVRECSELRILNATTRVVNLDAHVIQKFVEIAVEKLKQSFYNADTQLLNKIRSICGDTNTDRMDRLEINSDLSEQLICNIMTKLQSHYIPPSTSEHHLNLLNSGQFWKLIFRAEGHVENLHKHPHVQQIRDDINLLASLIAEKTIDIKSLQLILRYKDIELFTYFDCPNLKKKSNTVFVSKTDISDVRKQCKNYESTLNELRTYYETFCPAAKVSDVQEYLSKMDTESKMLSQIKLKDILSSEHWEFHSETIEMARKVYGFVESQTFGNIFNSLLSEVSEMLTVEDITKMILTKSLEKFAQLCKQYKDQDWEKLKCSDAAFLWKDVTNIELELKLMENYVVLSKSQKHYDNLVKALRRLASVPNWVVQLEQLSTIIAIFNVPHEKDNWLTKFRFILQDDILLFGKLNSFFDYLNGNLAKFDSDTCWPLIKELSEASELLEFFKSISEHDIRYLINGVGDFIDEQLNQEDVVASLIQVQQFLLQLMNKAKAGDISIKKFLADLGSINSDNPTLIGKITLCSSCNMALRNMYKNISNRVEVTKEKIQNAVKKGTYAFECICKDKKFTVALTYPSKVNNGKPYSLTDLQGLRGRALLIAKPTSAVNMRMDANEEDQIANAQIMNEFVRQVDLVHEICNVGAKLIQMGHFGYRQCEESVSGDNKMKELTELLETLKEDLNKWENIVDRAQETRYYLTFFPARHILTFLDYFTNDDQVNRENCKTLVRFVNEKARLLPIKKGGFKISSHNHLEILCEIGAKIKNIFDDIPIQLRPLKTKGVVVPSDIVHKGRLFVAACNDELLVPNIIMSIYTNHGHFPEPWQILICKSSTTMEELSIFIKRCFFAANNGYKDHLFCIANSEVLDFDLQYNLVNYIRSSCEKHVDYLLALICCRIAGPRHHILDQFSTEVVITNGLSNETMKDIYSKLCPNVACVSSDLSGQGKSEWIKQSSYLKHKIPRSFLISDEINFSKLVRQLKEFQLHEGESLHINIVQTNNCSDVNMFLFELLTLGFVFSDVDIACLPQTTVFIEIASTDEQRLLNSLPITSFFTKTHLSWDINNLIVSNKIHSPIQIVCHYLNAFDQATIDENNLHFSGEGAITQPLPAKRCQELVTKYFFDGSVDNISSFRFVEIFINVLADQLVRFSSSSYFRVENLKQIVKDDGLGLRTTLLRKLIDVSKDFATRSIQTKLAQLESIDAEDIKIDVKSWDDSNHLLVCFMSQSLDSICILYRDPKKVDGNVKAFLKSLSPNPSEWRLEDYNNLPDGELLNILECLTRKAKNKIDLPKYALSADNLIKMTLILLRARANIPVVVMGEAGCGKTSLISYLANVVEVKFKALNLHAGISEANILNFMSEVEKDAVNGEIWIFFDEINTCDHIGLLANLIAHRMLLEKLIHPNIRLFSACNPYRIRTKSQSRAGLKAKVNKYEEQSKLAYQVKPLPDQILDYVWDYGILQKNDEKKYIQIMTHKELKELNHPVLTELLFGSQEFIRSIEETYSVSLRDVKRAIKLIKFFDKSLNNRPIGSKSRSKYPDENSIPLQFRCYILALALCYQSRIYDQKERTIYRKDMVKIFKSKNINLDHNKFKEIIKQEQEDIVKRMNIPPNTALNEALLENVLAMTVCILTRIPVFIIGETGQNLRGEYSNDQFFQTLPQVYLIPHQGSSFSTSDDIIEVFQKANKFHETNTNKSPSIGVVLLEGVGFAETSPYNPLKVLHSLLEPSYPADNPSVSVVGIGNWRLDISKSSRALLVQRPKFGIEDLMETADRLLEGKARSVSLESLAEAYSEYEKTGQIHPNFHGLRDYYGLVKSLSMEEMTPYNIQMALARNFGGTDQNAKLREEYFENVLQMFNNYGEWKYEPISTPELINANLRDENARHLMVIGKSDYIINILTYQLSNQGLEPVVILGSQFPDDKQDYSYNVLSRIMMCVETGRPLILTDLDIIYGALYDLWNQNYIVYGNKGNPRYFTRIALGAYDPLLCVNKKFRCILVLDESRLDKADPSLLNRFEKQRLTIEDTLTIQQHEIVEILKEWVRQMGTLVSKNRMPSRSDFTFKDLFIGFNPDETLQSLVMYTMKTNPESQYEEILKKCKESLVAIASADGIVRATKSAIDPEESLLWKNIYFPSQENNNQHHDHLEDYFVSLFYELGLANPEPSLVIVNTFSNINTDVKKCLEKVARVQVDKLSTFKTEAQLQNRVKHFWLESNNQMLVLQCDVTTKNSGCIKLAKFIIEQYHNEFLRIKTPKMLAKHACIILHIHREQETTFNFICGWRKVTIETLTPQEKNLSSLLDGSLISIMKSTYPFEEILKQELLWCLLCMKYPSTENSISHIKMIISEIFKHPNFIECLKERTIMWIDEKSSTDWQYQVASNKRLLYPYSSFSAALHAYIRSLVRSPIAKMLYSLEKLSAIKTFFDIDQPENRMDSLITFWKGMFNDPKVITTDDLVEPNVYTLPQIYDLRFPFSYYFIKRIDGFKEIYLEEIAKLKQERENCDQLFIEDTTYRVFKSIVLSSILHLRDAPLEDFPELYFNDFVTVISSTDGGKKDIKLLSLILKQLLDEDKINDPFYLHIYWWTNSSTILAGFQLAQLCPTIVNDFSEKRVNLSFEDFLIQEVTIVMLNKLSESKAESINVHQIDQWHKQATKIITYTGKLIRSRKSSSFQLLRICNELVASKSISLKDIKEIIRLGLTSDEILSKEFINYVLKVLDKLEVTEKNLIPMRSFMTRCLDVISMDSQVILHLYQTIFSREPFPLIGSIISRIFAKEDDENIFFRIFENAHMILQRSPQANILNFMSEVEKDAVNGEIWIFFDEINTCDHIGLLANLIAHRMLLEKLIHPNIRLFSACNPYRIRTKSQSRAGLKAKVNKYEEQSKLAYQVKPLPDQILDYVWDYGILQKNDEKKYIQIMTHKELKELNHPVLTELLFGSQEFIRSIEETYSVSLRDVKRAIKLIKFFDKSLNNRPIGSKSRSKYPDENSIPLQFRCYILALALCYQSRIYDQKERTIYRKDMVKIFKSKNINLDHNKFKEIIKQEQEDIVKRMNIPPNTALNEALLENVLAMTVCILTRIPVFIIGETGSSKSLAIQLISQNLRGEYSNDQFFQTLPQVYLIPHQGSSFSTSDDIIELSESKAESINVHQIDQWHKQATKIITYTGKLIRSRKSSSFQLLRICNELVASKSISLKDIKEIIRLGLTSDEILSKEFINYVLKVLDKLEVTEKNLIPMRSFMTRCLDVISMDSQVILHLYQTIFSREPFPLIGSIISRIFAKEDDENIFFRIFENAHMILQRSPRLNVINTALKVKDLNSPMAALCCDIIQQNYFSELDMVDMIECFLSASNALLNAGVEPLQRISSIAFLKEFVGKLWDMTINTDDFTRPIAIDKIMEIGNFNVQAVLDQINNVMAIENPQIYSLKIYFLRDLRFRDFSIDDVKKFCKGQARTLPWLLSLELGDNNDNSLPFKTNNANDIESEINQTLTTVDISQLPRLWRKIGVNTFESFRAYYNGNLAQYKEQFPVLAVYFKYEERLTNVKHLWDIVKFVQLLSARLSYRLNRKEVYLIPHQGSSFSTSDDIIEVFQKANKFHETNTNKSPSIGVVLLEGVGFAETSPYNPLKVLHSLLEPSYPADNPSVSVVGIGNWRLDISKSSRALLVQRPKFGIEDLMETADRLLEGKARSVSLESLAEAYSEYEKTGQIHPNFHGLRDYYGLVKSLSMEEMTPYNIQMALARNFGGTDQNAKLREEYFENVLQMFNNYGEWKYEPISTPELINANLRDENARHLMVIGKSDYIINILTYQLSNQGLEPVVILGSQFPDDKQDYSYNVLSRIMMCVETGRPLILTDLDIIYGALYDLWNQNYIVYGNKGNPRYFTRIALGAYDPLLCVNKKFRCILVLDESRLDKADPSLLNRFEKQRLTIEDTLTIQQHEIVEILKEWVRQMGTLVSKNRMPSRSDFTFKDLFIGFNPDETLQSLVMYTMKTNPESQYEEILKKCKESLVAIASADGIVRATKSAIDPEESLLWKNIYFPSQENNNQHHDHLEDYFVSLFYELGLANPEPSLVIVNTFSNINTDVKKCLEKVARVQVDKLSTFKTEAQLQNRVKHFWLESNNQMLVLQCDVTTKNSGCIKLAKFIIEQYHNEFLRIKTPKMLAKHACIILHIHREQETTFNFICGWRKVTIETLTPQEKNLSSLLDGSLISIMKSTYPFEEILKQELLWCLLCMKYPSTENSISHIKMIISEIFKHPNFIECLKERTIMWIDEKSSTDWQYQVASNKRLLYPYSSFSAALHAYIRSLVRSPIAKMLYSLEKLSAIKTFFDIDQPENRMDSLITFWKDIKEIIRLGLTSDEILSKEFINYVLKVLDKLEVTEKNLIPMRSFMTRCLDVISMDSQVILHLYQTIFSREPFPLIGSIISRIFAKEDDENIFFRIFENAHMILQRSPRLNVINTALKVKDLNSPMAALCCDIIQQNYFSELDMVDMIECFLSASNALLNAGVEPLQRISSIAFLKEFVGKLWDMTINTDDFTRPIAIDKIMEIGNFNVQAVLDQINNVMAIENPQIYSLKIYFLRDLRFRDFSIDDVKKFCKGQARTLPWLLSLELGDNNDNSLPFKTNNANDIESEINQTLTTVDISQLPRLWRKIGVNTFESFRAYYNGNLAQYKEQFPVLAVYFKYEERLTNVKHLWDIVKFVQLLSARLSYRLNRKEVLALTFREYISSERNEALMTAYRDFENAWNSVIDNVDRYQRHKIDIKPIMHIDQKLILALIEPKDEGVFLCEMLEYLVSIQNKFIEEIMAIKPGTCRSLRFLEDSDSFDETEGPPQYYIQSLTLKQSRKDNLISYQWEDDYDGILQFSERNLGLGRGQEIIYDLQKIEQELARYLVFEKVHIEMIENTTLFVEPFSYHMELFQSSMRIIGDIRNLIPQEPISPEKAAAIVGIPTNSFNFSPDQMDTSIDNPSDILKALEILLCFVKRSPGGGGEFLIKEYAASWASLSEISENAKFNSLLNADLKLKHLVGLYELIEEQVANTTVKYVSEKYKAPITNDLVDSLNKVIDWTIPPSQQELLPADVFTLALKRFMYRCLQGETIDENIPLYIYVCDESLYFWPSSVSQELIDNLFPDEIMVSHTFTVYEFITKQIENLIQKQHQQKQPPQEPQQQRKIKVLIRDLISGYF